MTLDILRRTGGWCIELQQPLRLGPTKEITQIEIRPTTADHMIRWGQQRIPSTLALLAELTDVPERVLRQLPSHDFDRVMRALIVGIMPEVMKVDVEQGTRPLATPESEIPEQEAYVPPPDQIDPRFPAVDGPVVRMPPGPIIQPKPPEEPAPMNMMPPLAARPVH